MLISTIPGIFDAQYTREFLAKYMELFQGNNL